MHNKRGVYYQHLAAAAALLLLAAGLYFPFIHNPLVFDDKAFFSGRWFSQYATHIFSLNLRAPAYFSLASVEVLAGSLSAHRLLSLALHASCAIVVYRLSCECLRGRQKISVPPEMQTGVMLFSFLGAAFFLLHPVAVYGAGYLVQRSIILSTLFALLSLVFFMRGLRRGNYADAVSAALFYSLSVLSKEHSLLLPVVALASTALVGAERVFSARYMALFIAGCLPAAVLVVLLSKGVIGSAYEPDFGQIHTQLEDVFGRDVSEFPWSLSAATQAGLFFNYLGLWLWPDTGLMAIDLRVDFLRVWSWTWMSIQIALYLAFGALAFWMSRRRGYAGVAGFGMVYVWVMFLVEFSTMRFQEPFVLYRSYLWAPGIVVAMAAALAAFRSKRIALALAILALPVLFYQAHDRLQTFSSPLRLWQDAAARLPEAPIPWGSRTLYNLGREYLYSGQPEQAMAVSDRCMRQYPSTFHCYFARGAIHIQLGQYAQALPYMTRALELKPDDGVAHHHMGLILEHLGDVDKAKQAYRHASMLGFKGGEHQIMRLETPGQGLLPPGKYAPR